MHDVRLTVYRYTYTLTEEARLLPSRIARSLYSFHEFERKLGVQKLFDVFNLKVSIPIQSDLDDQSCFVDKRNTDGRVCIIGGLKGMSGEKKGILRRVTTDMDEHLPGNLCHGMDIDL